MFNKHDFITDNILTHDEIKKIWLSIYRAKGIGNTTFWKHYQKNHLFTDSPKIKVNHEIQQIKNFKANLIACFEEYYPTELFCLDAPPPLLTAKGNLSILTQPILAIVGARNASPQGMKIAFETSKFLAQHDFVIASGLARGIDKAAHEGAMLADKNHYSTIAVLAGGIDQIYPHEHHSIYHSIAEKGVILSEMPFSQSPIASLFPRRNHLIAALSKGLIIIEASLGSGTMITAEQGLALSKDIFVVPGSIKDPRYKGSHKLIKNGAILIDHPQDILDYYDLTPQKILASLTTKNINSIASNMDHPHLDKPSNLLLDIIPSTGITIEELYAHLTQDQLSASEISNLISKLEFEGIINRAQDGKFYLC